MPSFFTDTNGAELFVNGSREERYADGGIAPAAETTWALHLIKSTGPTKRLDDLHLDAIDVLHEDGVCISPYTVFQTPIHKDICRRFNQLSDLGQELKRALAEAGAFVFMDTLRDRSQAEATIERILTVFSMSTSGVWNLADAPLDFVHAVVDVFRTPAGTDWNRDLIGKSELTPQCLAQVIIGLAAIFDDKSLLAKSRKYRGETDGKNPGWLAFTYSKQTPDRDLVDFYKSFSRYSTMKPRQAQSTIIDMALWLKEAAPRKTLREAVSSKITGISFPEYLISRNHGQLGRGIVTSANAARIISAAIIDWYGDAGDDGPHHELVSGKEVQALTNTVAKLPKPTSSRSRPLPEKFVPIMKEILEEGPGSWLHTASNFQTSFVHKGRRVHRYCPVIPTLFRIMLEVPLRMGQLRRLDSGEGDVQHFNGATLSWEENCGPHAGYWAHKEGKSPRDSQPRGYAREIVGEPRAITGIFVNTNKTGAPYVMPWFLPKVLKMLWDLRIWQETYNPIPGPVGPSVYLDSVLDYSDVSRIAMPDLFPIARLFPTDNRPALGRTVTSSEIDHAWCALLAEIERRWNNRHPNNRVQLVEVHPVNGQPHRPAYNIHGLRVRGLTNLHRGGLPLDLLSKMIAGHATLSMTLYYIDRDPIEVADIVSKAATRADESQRRFIDDLRRMDVEEARKRTVCISEDAVENAITSQSKVQFCNVSIGICPYDGTRCADGGELRSAQDAGGKKKSIYGAVEPHDCIMCRHFVSGPPWLNELASYGTKLCEQRQHLAREQTGIEDTIVLLDKRVKAGELDKAVYENRFDQLQADICHIKDRQENVENAIFNVERLCNASIKLLKSTDERSNEILLITNERSSFVTYEEISEFEQSVRITKAGRVHRLLGDERVEEKRNKYLDVMLFNSGIAPPRLMTSITPEQCRRSMDQYASFLLARASSEEIDALLVGKLRLRDIGLEKEVRELIDAEISHPEYLPLIDMRESIRKLGGESK